MDKYEYKIRSEEIKELIAQGDYAEAAEIADTIDWRRVKSVMMLCTISDLYKINRRFEDARDMLLLAYDRRPGGRTIVYSLCELSIKMEEFIQAVEYYKEFVQIAPKDTGRYILQYKLYEAQEVSLEERIEVLEELKKKDYREKWAYELAYLYHRVGQGSRCVEECDELILWFGEGKYVTKAMELKMLHAPLTPEQQKKYESRFGKPAGETAAEPVQESGDADDIQVKTMDVGRYNTINLQKELAEGLKEVLGDSGHSARNAVTRSVAAPLMEADAMAGTAADAGRGSGYGREEYAGPDNGYGREEYAGPDNGYGREEYAGPDNGYGREEYAGPDNGYQQEEYAGQEDGTGAETYAEGKNGYAGGAYAEGKNGYAGGAYAGETQDSEVFFGETGEFGSVDPGQPITEEFLPEEEEPEEQASRPASKIVSMADYQRPYDRQMKELSIADEPEAQKETEYTGGEQPEYAQSGDEQSEYARSGDVQPGDTSGDFRDKVSDDTGEIVMEQLRQESLGLTGGEEAPAAGAGLPFIEPPKSLADVLSMEGDGQLSLVMPESEKIEKQITGQMSIEDILAEWERMKKDNEVKRREEVRKRVLEQTGAMFTEFEASVRDGLLEKLESENRQSEETAGSMEIPDAVNDMEPIDRVDSINAVQAPGAAELMGVTTFAGEPEEGNADISGDEDWVSGGPAENGKPENCESAVNKEPEDSEPAVNEELEDIEPSVNGELEYIEPSGNEEPEDNEPICDMEPPNYASASYEEENTGLYEQKDSPEAEAAWEDTAWEDIDSGEAESEDALDVTGEIDFAGGLEDEGIDFSGEDTEDGEETENGKAAAQRGGFVERDKAAVRTLTREERELFGPYIQNRTARERLVEALENISMASFTGNVIITGDEGMDTMTLAKNMIREVQMTDSNFSGKVAKISGQALNRKNVDATVQQFKNGALIIQKAAGMADRTAEELYKSLQKESFGIIVVIEDTKKAINKFLAEHEKLAGCFNARMDVEALSNDSLVAFGIKYAKEMEYSFEDLGVLALHTRIADLQTSDHAVTVMEVKEIVDEAIRRANKKTLRHFFDILLAKRYDEEDMIILRENDFV